MIDLILTLVPIALLDSLSVVPVALVPLVLLVTGGRPIAGPLAFLGGIFLTYFPFGLLLSFGLDHLFAALGERFTQWWNSTPDFGEVLFEIGLGGGMVLFGRRLYGVREMPSGSERTGARMTPLQGFTVAALLNLSGLWGALPYFAAIAQILKEDPSPTAMVLLLLFYNLVFLLPLLALLALHRLPGDQGARLFRALGDFLSRWGHRILSILLIGFGLLLILDGIGWLYGIPLLVPSGFETPLAG